MLHLDRMRLEGIKIQSYADCYGQDLYARFEELRLQNQQLANDFDREREYNRTSQNREQAQLETNRRLRACLVRAACKRPKLD